MEQNVRTLPIFLFWPSFATIRQQKKITDQVTFTLCIWRDGFWDDAELQAATVQSSCGTAQQSCCSAVRSSDLHLSREATPPCQLNIRPRLVWVLPGLFYEHSLSISFVFWNNTFAFPRTKTFAKHYGAAEAVSFSTTAEMVSILSSATGKRTAMSLVSHGALAHRSSLIAHRTGPTRCFWFLQIITPLLGSVQSCGSDLMWLSSRRVVFHRLTGAS